MEACDRFQADTSLNKYSNPDAFLSSRRTVSVCNWQVLQGDVRANSNFQHGPFQTAHSMRAVSNCLLFGALRNLFRALKTFDILNIFLGAPSNLEPEKLTVASMLLIFPCVRLDCVSSASKTCLDYVWSVNVFMLSV